MHRSGTQGGERVLIVVELCGGKELDLEFAVGAFVHRLGKVFHVAGLPVAGRHFAGQHQFIGEQVRR